MWVTICNAGAWVLSGLILFLLLFDFIKTERKGKNNENDGESEQ